MHCHVQEQLMEFTDKKERKEQKRNNINNKEGGVESSRQRGRQDFLGENQLCTRQEGAKKGRSW